MVNESNLLASNCEDVLGWITTGRFGRFQREGVVLFAFLLRLRAGVESALSAESSDYDRKTRLRQRIQVDAVGTTITDRPPHRTVRAHSRIRLPPWMSGDEAFEGIRMQNAGCWNPTLKDRSQPIPQRAATLTATAQDQPPQTSEPLGEDI